MGIGVQSARRWRAKLLGGKPSPTFTIGQVNANPEFGWRPLTASQTSVWARLLAAIEAVDRTHSWCGTRHSALVRHALATGLADGFASATLDADADWPAEAAGIYERLGFTVRNTWVTQTKQLTS